MLTLGAIAFAVLLAFMAGGVSAFSLAFGLLFIPILIYYAVVTLLIGLIESTKWGAKLLM